MHQKFDATPYNAYIRIYHGILKTVELLKRRFEGFQLIEVEESLTEGTAVVLRHAHCPGGDGVSQVLGPLDEVFVVLLVRATESWEDLGVDLLHHIARDGGGGMEKEE